MKSLGVFDIGSNTLLMTLGRRGPDGATEILLDIGEVARMSEGLRDGGNLHPPAKARVLETLARFQQKAQSLGVSRLIAAGTAAFRRASDGRAFAEEIQKKLGIPVRILSGEEEAAYSYASARHDFGREGQALGVIDIGGGSTELVFSEKGPRFSLPIGTVRLTEALVRSHPIPDSEWSSVRQAIQRVLEENCPSPQFIPNRWVAVAATPASLAAVFLKLPAYDPQKVHGFILKRNDLENLVEDLRNKSIPERNQMPGMDPKRSELLPIGGLILLTIADYLQLPEIVVSDHGLRYGVLFEELSRKDP